jgi:hypothetical protein
LENYQMPLEDIPLDAQHDPVAPLPLAEPASRTRGILQRSTFRTSRLLDFASEKELTAQTGHPPAC